jgi:phospholipid/cholesterol/gamma-HCH transport system ATP-binding protein
MGIFDALKQQTEPVIQVKNITCRYGEDTILRNVSFDIFKGEVFIILGGSGCGKSTILKHIIGLYEPAEGDILIKGRSIVHASAQEKVEIQKGRGALPKRRPVREHDAGGEHRPAPAGIH